MHATAAVLNQKQNGFLEKYDHGIFNKHTKGFAPLFENLLEVCANFAGDCSELGSYYKNKLMKLKPFLMDYAAKVHDLNPQYFHTLIHGDFWINNVMLRYDETRQIQDIKVVDFQFCNWSNPAIDLHYFFNTSLESDLRLHAQDELVQYYHYVLSETLRELKYALKIPSLHEFCIQVEAARFNAITSALVVQAVMLNENNEDSDIQALMQDNERGRKFRNMLYNNKVVQENAKVLLPFFDKKGLLDVNE